MSGSGERPTSILKKVAAASGTKQKGISKYGINKHTLKYNKMTKDLDVLLKETKEAQKYVN